MNAEECPFCGQAKHGNTRESNASRCPRVKKFSLFEDGKLKDVEFNNKDLQESKTYERDLMEYCRGG